MKYILKKDLNLGLVLIILFIAALVGGFMKWPLFIPAGVFLMSYIFLDKKKLRCPNCGGHENLDRLIYAKKHRFYCRHCGENIEIR